MRGNPNPSPAQFVVRWIPRVHTPNSISIGSSVLAQLTVMAKADRQITLHATLSRIVQYT